MLDLCHMSQLHSHVKNQSTQWLREYAHGASFELYDVRFSSAFHRKSFSEAVELCFERLGVLLVAVGFTPNARQQSLADAAAGGSANSSRRPSTCAKYPLAGGDEAEAATSTDDEDDADAQDEDVGDVEEVLVNPANPPLSIQVGTMKAFVIAANESAAKRCASRPARPTRLLFVRRVFSQNYIRFDCTHLHAHTYCRVSNYCVKCHEHLHNCEAITKCSCEASSTRNRTFTLGMWNGTHSLAHVLYECCSLNQRQIISILPKCQIHVINGHPYIVLVRK